MLKDQGAPACVLDKETAVVMHCEVISQNPFEGRYAGIWWMCGGAWFAELLWIIHQDRARRCLTRRKHVSELHLSGLIDDDDDDGVREILSRP